ncbi:MAG: carbohydrate kinase [Actinomycetota bacterium]|nr:carbohydrate kinase [Actinomycetota bacterium]
MSLKIIGIGEILWDIFPGGRKLGGAPANFAYFIKNLGQNGLTASRIGNDPPGTEILDSLKDIGLDERFIQVDSKYPTGTVVVKIKAGGQPDYIISEKVAWDFLEFSDNWKKLSREADVICFGTLAQRSLKSRRTITNFLKLSGNNVIKVFDINLRQNFFSLKTISQSLELATILKLNQDELEVLKNFKGFPHNSDDIGFCRKLIGIYDISLICVTRGENGSLLVDKDRHYDHPGYKVIVADTVGAGDAFTAAMVIRYLQGGTLENTSIFANRLGSWVASRSGPTPELDGEIKGYL